MPAWCWSGAPTPSLAIVEDNGHGFNVDQMLDSSLWRGSIALACTGMHERAALVGATLPLSNPTPGEWPASVFVETPIQAREREAVGWEFEPPLNDSRAHRR